jgi:hypothetical protein
LQYWKDTWRGSSLISVKTLPLGKVHLTLYEAKLLGDCCQDLKRVTEITTGANGEFAFGQIPPGGYWVVADWNGRQYKLPVDFTPDTKGEDGCDKMTLSIDSHGSMSVEYVGGGARM